MSLESDALLGNGPSANRTTPEDVFAQFDTDGSGALSLQEVRAALTKLSLPVDERVERLFNALDIDGNGTLSVDEFVKVCSDMDPSAISAEGVAREIDSKASFLENLGTTVADGVTAATGATASPSSSSSSSISAKFVCQAWCIIFFVLIFGFCAYTLYVGFKFNADPSAVCRRDATWLPVYGCGYILTVIFPFLLLCCSGKMKMWCAKFFGSFMLFMTGWGIYGITLFFHSEAQNCNRELYLFGYTLAIIFIVVLSIMCCSLPFILRFAVILNGHKWW